MVVEFRKGDTWSSKLRCGDGGRRTPGPSREVILSPATHHPNETRVVAQAEFVCQAGSR